MSDANALLAVRGLDVFYGRGASRKQAIFDAEFTIAPGEVIGLIGETGSGKSTLARTILGLIPPARGSIRFEGAELTGLGRRQRERFRRSGAVQYVFQDPLRSLDPDFTLEESIAEPLVSGGGHSRTEAAVKVRDYLARVGLDESLLGRLPGQVSGGQRQRAAIARALISEPRLLILDEPVSALDSANRVQILDLLQELASPSVSLLFISHDLGSVAGITDRVIVLYRGRVVEIDDTDTIVNAPAHPYTQLLVGSAPTLGAGTGAGAGSSSSGFGSLSGSGSASSSRAWRDDLRSRLGSE